MKVLKADNWHAVCQKSDLIANSGICALVNGQQVAIFYLPGEKQTLYAIGNWDPIGNANVLSRGIIADIGGELTVASPLYKQHFSLISGRCLEDDSACVPVYEIAIDGDTVLIGA